MRNRVGLLSRATRIPAAECLTHDNIRCAAYRRERRAIPAAKTAVAAPAKRNIIKIREIFLII